MNLLTSEEIRVLLSADGVAPGQAAFEADVAVPVAGLLRLGFLKQVYLNESPVLTISESGREAASRIREWKAMS